MSTISHQKDHAINHEHGKDDGSPLESAEELIVWLKAQSASDGA